jgi:hypothetical protein
MVQHESWVKDWDMGQNTNLNCLYQQSILLAQYILHLFFAGMPLYERPHYSEGTQNPDNPQFHSLGTARTLVQSELNSPNPASVPAY